MWKFFLSIYRYLGTLLAGSGLTKIKLIRIFHEFLIEIFIKKIHPDFVVIHGHKLFLNPRDPVISAEIFVRSGYEPIETEFVKKMLHTGEVVLDIGANIGWFTLLFSKQIGPNGKVYAFEPDLDNFALLKKSVEANSLSNVILANKAVSDQDQKLLLYRSSDNPGDHTIYPIGDRKPVEVDAIRLDNLFNDPAQIIDFIKLDIQGAEGKALAGMKNLLRDRKDIKILTEFYPAGLEGCGTKPSDYLQALKALGFNFFEIGSGGSLENTSIQKLTDFYTPSNKNFTTLYCVRQGETGPNEV